MKIHFLSYHFPWFGKHIGYENMIPYLRNFNCLTTLNKDSKINRAIGKVIKTFNHWENVRSDEAFTGWQFKKDAHNYDISHILYLETYLFLLKNSLRRNESIIGTIHLPMNRWTQENLSYLANLKAAIILYNEEANEFAKYIGSDKLHVLRYGIDTKFFRMDKRVAVIKNQILFVGHYLRDFDLLFDVFHLIKKEIGDDFEFHFVIPPHYRNEKVLASLAKEPNVYFFEKLTDEELLHKYQTSYVMLMPMKDSGVNTAIMQALSIGLPVITNDAGGIKSYGGNTIFPVAKSEAYSLAELFYRYYRSTEFRDEISMMQRSFAEAELDWSKIAKEHAAVYQKLKM